MSRKHRWKLNGVERSVQIENCNKYKSTELSLNSRNWVLFVIFLLMCILLRF